MTARYRFLASLMVLAFVVSACTHPSRDQYTAEDVGRMVDTSRATVIAARAIDIGGGENTGIGAVAGGAAAGSVANAAVDKNGYNLAATIIGGLAGAGLGFLVEEEARSRQGIEYVVRTEDGRVVTLVQNRGPGEEMIEPGKPVLIQYGRDYTRVVDLPEGVTPPKPAPDDGRDHNGLDSGRGTAPAPSGDDRNKSNWGDPDA